MACKKQRLHVWDKTERYGFFNEWMLDPLLLPRLPRGDDGLARRFFQEDSASLLLEEIFALHLSSIDKRKGETVGDGRAQFFHEIERETGPARPVGMEKSNRRIEADTLEGGFYIVAQERIDE